MTVDGAADEPRLKIGVHQNRQITWLAASNDSALPEVRPYRRLGRTALTQAGGGGGSCYIDRAAPESRPGGKGAGGGGGGGGRQLRLGRGAAGAAPEVADSDDVGNLELAEASLSHPTHPDARPARVIRWRPLLPRALPHKTRALGRYGTREGAEWVTASCPPSGGSPATRRCTSPTFAACRRLVATRDEQPPQLLGSLVASRGEKPPGAPETLARPPREGRPSRAPL